MKSPIPLNEFHAAIARHEKAQADLDSANKKVRKAKSNLEKATADVEAAEAEFKLASSNLEQTVKKHVNAALKKGGPDVSLAIAALLAKTATSGDAEQPQMDLLPKEDATVIPVIENQAYQEPPIDLLEEAEKEDGDFVSQPQPSYSISDPA